MSTYKTLLSDMMDAILTRDVTVAPTLFRVKEGFPPEARTMPSSAGKTAASAVGCWFVWKRAAGVVPCTERAVTGRRQK